MAERLIMKILFAHPTGNANARETAAALHRAGILDSFLTSIASFEGTGLDRFGGIGPLSELRRRRFSPELQVKTKTWPGREIARLLSSQLKLKHFTRHETGPFSIDAVYQSISRRHAKLAAISKTVTAVYAYEDGAKEVFQAGRVAGLSNIYDLPIGYWRAARRLLVHEYSRHPEWAATLTGFLDSEAKLARKDDEIRLADHIFVASSFTAKTLEDFPGILPPVHVIPYGFPEPTKEKIYNYDANRSLKLLFVGGLSQRKGIADLFAAVEKLGCHAELTVIGSKSSQCCPALDTALTKHRWMPSLPHHRILEEMRNHDLLVFPSLFEGFGLVITEAMSQGTPVLTTDRTAGPDLIEHGRNGWIIAADEISNLHETIENILHKPKEIELCGRAALESARARPWSAYGDELARCILSIYS